MNKYVSWGEVDKLCHELAQTLKANSAVRHGSGILAVARGGLVPATILAYAMRLPILGTLAQPNTQCSAREDLLIVDDICDTGRTFADLRRNFANSVYIAMIVKPAGTLYCHCWAQAVPQDYWVVFPWAPYDEINR